MLTPRTNPALFGHDAAERAFIAAASGSRLHHAWLLTGPSGIGKATLAFRLARFLLSPQAPHDSANPVFNRVAKGSHADLLTIEREWDEKRRRFKGDIPVDLVRTIRGFLQLTPAEGGWRVVILDGAESLNRFGANALLKILEEPPRRAILLLTTDAPGRLLPTIRSRCRQLRLDPLNEQAMARALDHLLPAVSPAERQGLAAIARGAPGRAVALAEEGALELADLARETLAAAPSIPIPRRHDIATRALRSETGFGTYMELLQAALGDAVRAVATGGGAGGAAALLAGRPLSEWGEVWHALRRLQDETERFNLDKRAAVIAGLELLTGP